MLSTKPPRCKWCKERTEKIGKVLHDACVDSWIADCIKKQKAKKQREQRARAKVERAKVRARREKLKSRRDWLRECIALANKYARVRDRDDGCISCDRASTWDGQWHGSHYRSVGAASAVCLNLLNINKACSICNHHLSGNIAGYKPRLIAKIGLEKVEWLESQNQLADHNVEYLKKYKRVIGKRLRRLEKQRENA